MRSLLALAGFILVAAAWPAHAEDEVPGRVGRVANVQGALHHATGENAADWDEIGQNYPIAEGDNLWLDGDGGAEIDYGGGEVRLAGGTNLHVSRLTERQLALFVATGRIIVRVRTLGTDDSVRIDTPTAQVALVRPGLYRIDVAPDRPQSTLLVREGEAQVVTDAGTEPVYPGQTATLSGVAGERADIGHGGGLDGFDTWSAARDRVYEQPGQYAYVSRQMVGAADLASYGMWQTYPEYGAVWFPTSVSPDWAPYRHGHWTWLTNWGYTWVDDAPWGYAPFHYGRWAYVGGRWGWCPGAFVARPLWAPALVAWYGGGGLARSAAHASGVYGWVPLGWREPVVPWWGHCTSHCWSRYNRPYGVDGAARRDVPPASHANRHAPGGVTAVPGAALINGRPVASHRVPVAANTASTLSLPPVVKPIAPVRPAHRIDAQRPAPASTLQTTRMPIPAAPSDRGERWRVAPVAPSQRPTATTIVPIPPAAAPARAATIPAAPTAVPRAVPPASAVVPRAVPPAPAQAAPRAMALPAPPLVAPSAVPQAVAPVPAPRGAIRAIPPNPRAVER